MRWNTATRFLAHQLISKQRRRGRFNWVSVKCLWRKAQPKDPYHSFDDGDLLTMVGLQLRYRLMRQERINVVWTSPTTTKMVRGNFSFG
ncbi:hypothetical protein O9992_15475 [Vibrio lentus]|nr:hypothetical protein [Vibrio lentus]